MEYSCQSNGSLPGSGNFVLCTQSFSLIFMHISFRVKIESEKRSKAEQGILGILAVPDSKNYSNFGIRGEGVHICNDKGYK